MAAADDREKSQAATDRQRERFAQRGEFARSRELSGAATLAACVAMLAARGPAATASLVHVMRGSMARAGAPLDATLWDLVLACAGRVLLPLVVVAPLMAAAINALQRRGRMGLTVAGFDATRLDPFAGLARLLGLRAAVGNVLASLAKLAVLTGVLWWTWQGQLPELVQHTPASLRFGLGQAGDVLGVLLWRGLATLLVLGAADFALSSWRMERRMRMSAQEVRDEHKEAAGDPATRGRRRKKHQELVRARSLREVPQSDVVLVNPTHVAVALRYDAARMGAPRVVAKGADAMASRIRQVARRHGVPVWSQPPLARLLYAQVKLGHPIPEDMYRAVAVVLAHVYRRQGRHAQN